MTDIRVRVLNALKEIAKEATTEELYTNLITVDSPDQYYSDTELDLDDLILKIEANMK
jgi:hypothetical protein